MPEQNAHPRLMEQIVANPKLARLKIGREARLASGAQDEFIAANVLQAHAMNCVIILRAGSPPQYNKIRSPKSGLNLSKTSNQGFFKGAIPKDERFARVNVNSKTPMNHKDKDKEHLSLPLTDPDYQHTKQLDINMMDILRETTNPSGDLKVLGFNKDTGILRLGYKEGKGDPGFQGQFVVHLKKDSNTPTPQFYSREWDKPSHHPDWDPITQTVKQNEALQIIPKDIYQKVFNQTFYLSYTEQQTETITVDLLHPANVFANRARSSEEFKKAMDQSSPEYALIKNKGTLREILETLHDAYQEEADNIILGVYNNTGLIVAGDWDGLALGTPPSLHEKYKEVFNTLSHEGSIYQKMNLISRTKQYFKELKQTAESKPEEARSPMDNLLISTNAFKVSEFALSRAGCITPHEFLFQQLINQDYRNQNQSAYRENIHWEKLKTGLESNVINEVKKRGKNNEELLELITQEIQKASSKKEGVLPRIQPPDLPQKILARIQAMVENPKKYPTLPHALYDMNIQELYQHGFEMRNPYPNINLEGSWLMVLGEGVLYGETQEELIETILTGDLLKQNQIDIHPNANMEAGWHRVIARQMELGHTIPEDTEKAYNTFKKSLEEIYQTRDKWKQAIADLKSLNPVGASATIGSNQQENASEPEVFPPNHHQP